MKILIALLIFGLIILIHELGHFLFAKKSGVFVQEFSLGMGPTLCSFTKNETKYCLKLLPIGGSCMMLGEDDESHDDRAFGNKSVWARISVIAAGPIFNFILAYILSVFLLSFTGYTPTTLAGVTKGSPAAEAGLQVGDKITKVNGDRVYNFSEVSLYNQLNKSGKALTFEYKRDNTAKEVTITPKLNETGSFMIGIEGKRVKGDVLSTLKYSAIEVRYWIKATVLSLKELILGKVNPDQLAGPVGIVNVIGNTYDAAKSDGFLTVLLNLANISILLSANLGVMNLLPLPALDGGRLVFLILEAIRKKKVAPEKEGMVHFVGLVLLMGLMLFVVFNDIKNIFF